MKGVYGVYGAGAQAPMGDYGVSMLCGREPHPKTSFLLFAGPTQEGLGRWVYCAEADGRLRKARRRRNNFCLKEGAPAD